MKKMLISAGIAAGVLLSGAAYAGYKWAGGVGSITPTYASVVPGAARASGDTNSYGGCTLLNSGTSAMGWCTIADASGATKTCSFSNAAMIQAVTSITPNSAIRLFFDSAGNCTQLYIDTYSFYLPVTP